MESTARWTIPGRCPPDAQLNRVFLTGNVAKRGYKCSTTAAVYQRSLELMTRVRNVLESQCMSFKFAEGPVAAVTNPSAIIYTHVDVVVPNNHRLANTHGGMHSMECFGSSAANMANNFGFKRQRSNRAYGPCYTVANAAPAGWNATANWNFEMREPFEPVYGDDYPALRTDRFIEESLTGSRADILREWVQKTFESKRF